MSVHSMIETLESRTLLSVSSVPVLFNPTIRADRLAVKAELLKFRSDIFSCQAMLLRDTQAIRHDLAKGDTSLVASFQQLHADTRAMRSVKSLAWSAASAVTLPRSLMI